MYKKQNKTKNKQIKNTHLFTYLIHIVILQNDGLVVGADDFLPFLIYTVLTADLRHIQSNIRFVERYIDGDEMQGEAYYYFIQLNSAVSYLSGMSNEKAQATIAERREQKREKELRMRQYLSADPSLSSTSSSSIAANDDNSNESNRTAVTTTTTTTGTAGTTGTAAAAGIDLAYFERHEVTTQLRSHNEVDPRRLNDLYEKLALYAQTRAVRYSGSGARGRVVCRGAEFPPGTRVVGALCVSKDEVVKR